MMLAAANDQQQVQTAITASKQPAPVPKSEGTFVEAVGWKSLWFLGGAALALYLTMKYLEREERRRSRYKAFRRAYRL